jgi:hypothetical protein
MKDTVFTFLLFFLFNFSASAQAPQAFNYQAVVRNATGQVLANQSVGLKIDLVQNDIVYSETHAATTNAFGLVNLNVGRGAVQFGQFDTIHWEQHPVNIKISLDAAGGSNYEVMGASELLSVPYALYADKAAEVDSLPADAEKGDLLYYDGTAWQRLPSGAAGAALTMGADSRPFWKTPPTAPDSLMEVIMSNGDVIYFSMADHNPPRVLWINNAFNLTPIPDISTVDEANLDFNGESNTNTIVAHYGDNNGVPYAAKVCADLVAHGFDDWYLPAAGELNEIYLKLGPKGSGQIYTGWFWSSSGNNEGAWFYQFEVGSQSFQLKDLTPIGYRCVRR